MKTRLLQSNKQNWKGERREPGIHTVGEKKKREINNWNTQIKWANVHINQSGNSSEKSKWLESMKIVSYSNEHNSCLTFVSVSVSSLLARARVIIPLYRWSSMKKVKTNYERNERVWPFFRFVPLTSYGQASVSFVVSSYTSDWTGNAHVDLTDNKHLWRQFLLNVLWNWSKFNVFVRIFFSRSFVYCFWLCSIDFRTRR